jgi:hypothetical protein
MLLPGRLAKTTIGDLLGRLYRAGASGALELSGGARRQRIYLQRGLIVGLDLDVGPLPARLGELLVCEGLAAVDQVARALSAQQRLGIAAPRHGEILVRAGVITPELRDAALRKQARKRLDALFRALDGRDAEIRFHVGIAAEEAKMTHRFVAPLMPHEFLAGRPRARDGATPRAPAVSPSSSAPSPGTPRPPSAGPHAHDAASSAPPRTTAFERLRALRLLGLEPTADVVSIRRAFRTAAAKLHPDRHEQASIDERTRAHRAFTELSAAYHLLCA